MLQFCRPLHALRLLHIDGGRPGSLPRDSSGYVQLTIEPRDAAFMKKKNHDDYENMIAKKQSS